MRGEGVHARMVAIMLAQALEPHGCKVAVSGLDEEAWGCRSVMLGPTTHRTLSNLGVPLEQLFQAGATLNFRWSLRGMTILVSPFGRARGGAEFHHHLHRVKGELSYADMLAYNPAHLVAESMAKSGLLQRPPVPFGLIMERTVFCRLLDTVMQAQGIAVAGNADVRSDVTFTVLGDGSAEWDEDQITVPTTGAFPELGLYRCIKSVDRFLSLLTGLEEAAPQRREFNRLSQAEDERISDFAALLVNDFNRPAVARKVQMFRACGRIPVEDYEVIPPHYWLSVLLQMGIVPRDYDRLADRFPLDDTRTWLAELRAQIAQIARCR